MLYQGSHITFQDIFRVWVASTLKRSFSQPYLMRVVIPYRFVLKPSSIFLSYSSIFLSYSLTLTLFFSPFLSLYYTHHIWHLTLSQDKTWLCLMSEETSRITPLGELTAIQCCRKAASIECRLLSHCLFYILHFAFVYFQTIRFETYKSQWLNSIRHVLLNAHSVHLLVHTVFFKYNDV